MLYRKVIPPTTAALLPNTGSNSRSFSPRNTYHYWLNSLCLESTNQFKKAEAGWKRIGVCGNWEESKFANSFFVKAGYTVLSTTNFAGSLHVDWYYSGNTTTRTFGKTCWIFSAGNQ